MTKDGPVNMNKARLAEALAQRTGLAYSVAYEAVEGLFDIIVASVVGGQPVSVSNFGRIEMIQKSPRQHRNPQTGGIVDLPARNAFKMTFSPRIKIAANSGDPALATIRKRARRPRSEAVGES